MPPDTPLPSPAREPTTETAAWEDQRAKYEDRQIPLELIDEPSNPERETMEETDLAELAISISEIGLIKPLIVDPRGDRFETVAGHRRLLACRLAQYSPVPCRVRIGGDVDPMAILVAENAHVEPVNPVEEARFYDRLLREKCQGDCDLLALKVRRRREYVEDRLILLQGYPNVIEALHRKLISMAVARQLNKSRDPNRLLVWLDVAINQGASARTVAQWQKDAEQLGPLIPLASDPNDQTDNPAAIVPGFELKCWFCDSKEYPTMMELLYMHKYCLKALENMLNRGSAPAPGQQ